MRRLPRRKLCGGGLTPKAQALVPPSALAVAERRIMRAELRHGRSCPLALHYPEAGIAMVERDRFDLALTEAAARAGAGVHDREPVRQVGEDADGAWVLTDRGRRRANPVVLADGEPSRLGRGVGLGSAAGGRWRWRPTCRSRPMRRRRRPSWRSTFGAGTPGTSPRASTPTSASARIASGAQHHCARVWVVSSPRSDWGWGTARLGGHWIPQGLRRGPLATPRILLASDSAATADPLFGEGIPYAIASGAVAAQTIGLVATGQLPDLRAYDARLRRSLGPALDRLGLLAQIAEASMTLALLGLRFSSAMREAAVDAIAGRQAPFALEHDCHLACVCRLAHEPGPGPGAALSFPPAAWATAQAG